MQTLSIELQQWYQHALGYFVYQAEKRLLEQLWPTLWGRHLVQAPGLSGLDWLRTNRFTVQTFLNNTPSAMADSATISTHFEEWPITTNSVDLVFLPHLLEFCPHRQAIIQEAARVLSPGGHLVILGFNPISFLGAFRLIKKFYHHNLPWNGRYIHGGWLRRLLTQYHLSSLQYQTCFFRPPFQRISQLQQMQFMESIGARCWNHLGSSYLLLAQKQAIPLTPIFATLANKLISSNGKIPEPSTTVRRKSYDNPPKTNR